MFITIDLDHSSLNDIRQACQFGFFYLRFPMNLTIPVFQESQNYFNQSTNRKMVDLTPKGQLVGYLPSGRVKNNNILELELKESLTYVRSSTNQIYNHYMNHTSIMAHRLFNRIIESLGVDPLEYQSTITPSFENLALIHYPTTTENNCGISAHTDWGYLTLLATDSDGLQIQVNNDWIDVPTRPDCLIVNLGDIMQLLSSGQYHSISHRVQVKSEKYSIAFFFEPNLDAIVTPVNCNDRYQPMTYRNLLQVNH